MANAMKADFEALLKALDDHDQEVHYLLDCKTGAVARLTLKDKAALADMQQKMTREKGRYVPVPKVKPRTNFEELEQFVSQLTDPHFKQRCKGMLASHRPFREFRDALSTRPNQARAWEAFHRQNLERRARYFLESSGLR